MISILLFDIVIQSGEFINYDDASWYNSNWFTSIISAILSAFIGVYIAIKTVKLDHKKQQETKGQEERKRLQDLEIYFYETCTALVESVNEQIDEYRNMLLQLSKKTHGNYLRRRVPSMNLTKVYYLSPPDAFQIFVLNREGNNKENIKKLMSIYKSFDSIEHIIELDKTYSERFNIQLEQKSKIFTDAVRNIEQLAREYSTFVRVNKAKELLPFMIGISKIIDKWSSIEKFNGMDITKAELLDKIHAFTNTEDGKASIRNEFLNPVLMANSAIAECIEQEELYENLISHYIEKLESAKNKIEEGLEKIKLRSQT